MTQNELNKILKKHKLWLYSFGFLGKRVVSRDVDLRFDNLRGVNLIAADLSGLNLRDADLKGIDLTGAILHKAILRNADLRFADLTNADLRDANLEGVNLRDAYLTNADLSGANLKDVNLICANLKGANLKYANLTNVNLTGSNLNGTGVYLFKGPRHDVNYNSKDDKLYIGCQVHTLEHWLQNYIDIGKKYKYTDKQIEAYGNWFKSLKELS